MQRWVNGLLAIMSILLGSPPVYSLTTVLSQENESIAIDWPDAEGWIVGHQQDVGDTAIVETVRQPETVENWTEIGTTMIYRNKVGIALDRFNQIVFERTQSLTQEATLESRAERLPGEHDSRIFVIRAKNYQDGTSETQVQLWVQGDQALYNIQRTKRTADLDQETVDRWVRFLMGARVVEK